MGLTAKCFAITDRQLNAINQYFQARQAMHAAAGQDVGMHSIKVEFEWVPGLGRFVTAHYDSEISGYEVESAGDNQVP
jgi:hypothetical protein